MLDHDPLEKHYVDELAEHQPSVELGWNILPLVAFAHLHLQLLLPPLCPLPALLAARFGVDIKPAPSFELADDPAFLALFAEEPREAKVVGTAPEGKVEEEERRAEDGVVSQEIEERRLGHEGEEGQARERGAV